MHPSSLKPLDIDGLDPAERFLLWAMRAWVQCCKARALPAVAVESAFVEFGLPEAAGALDSALRNVAQATMRPLLVHCPHCSVISDDERLLLAATAAAQNQNLAAGHRALSDIVPSVQADHILDRLRSFGLLLALVGIDLPARDLDDISGLAGVRAPAFSPPTLH